MAGITLRGIGEENEQKENSAGLPSEQEHGDYSEPTVVDEEKVKEGLRQLRAQLAARRSADRGVVGGAPSSQVPPIDSGAIAAGAPGSGSPAGAPPARLPGMAAPRLAAGSLANSFPSKSGTLPGVVTPPPGVPIIPAAGDPMSDVITPPPRDPPMGGGSTGAHAVAQAGVSAEPSARHSTEGVPEAVIGADATLANPRAAAAAAAAELAQVSSADSAQVSGAVAAGVAGSLSSRVTSDVPPVPSDVVQLTSGAVQVDSGAVEQIDAANSSRPWYDEVPTADQVYAEADARKTRWVVWSLIGVGLVTAVAVAAIAGLNVGADSDERATSPESRAAEAPPTATSPASADPAAPASEAEMARPATEPTATGESAVVPPSAATASPPGATAATGTTGSTGSTGSANPAAAPTAPGATASAPSASDPERAMPPKGAAADQKPNEQKPSDQKASEQKPSEDATTAREKTPDLQKRSKARSRGSAARSPARDLAAPTPKAKVPSLAPKNGSSRVPEDPDSPLPPSLD